MNIQEFLSIGLVGAIVSAVTEYVSRKFDIKGTQAKMVTIILSILFGGLVMYLQHTNAWSAIAGVLASASTVYALLRKNETN